MPLFKSSKKNTAKLKKINYSTNSRIKTGLFIILVRIILSRITHASVAAVTVGLWIFLCQWFATTAVFIFNCPKFSWWERPERQAALLPCPLTNPVSSSQPPPCLHRHVSAHLSSPQPLLWGAWSPLVERNIEDPRPDYCKHLILLWWHSSQPLSVGTGGKDLTHTHTHIQVLNCEFTLLEFKILSS